MSKPVAISIRRAVVARRPVEIVERKGRGHPDTICDAVADEVSRALCRYYLEHFDAVLHHNVDKALLIGGSSSPEFGGGRIDRPMEIFLAGRAVDRCDGAEVPVGDIALEACRHWLGASLHALDVERNVVLHPVIRPGSTELVELFGRARQTGGALANDTSCGVGYAPLSELEQVVLAVERHLNSAETKARNPETGEDVKVMGIRRDGAIGLTVACAFVDRHLRSIGDYLDCRREVAEMVETTARGMSDLPVSVVVNAADDEATGSVYLTVSGTSAEAGDDGEVGRGNRVNGLITPYRPMNMEAAAGKNPVTHVGKIYNVLAGRLAERLVAELDGVEEAYCYLVSRIGQPVGAPQIVDVELRMQQGATGDMNERRAREIVFEVLDRAGDLTATLIRGEVGVY